MTKIAETHSDQNDGADWKQYAKVVRHKDFAKRIEMACENHPHAPSGHGRQIWLKNALEEKFSEVVSREAVRKWFAGEARPKPKMMSIVARALAVDEAWLALGITPSANPVEKRKQNALAAGAVNLVAAQIQLAGGNIAFPENTDQYDINAIIRGKSHNIAVRLFNTVSHFPLDIKDVVIVTSTERKTVFSFFHVPVEVVMEKGTVRGNYIELNCEMVSGKLIVGDRAVPEITDFQQFEMPKAA